MKPEYGEYIKIAVPIIAGIEKYQEADRELRQAAMDEWSDFYVDYYSWEDGDSNMRHFMALKESEVERD